MNKEECYSKLLLDSRALIDPEVQLQSNMANISALLHETLKQHWTGFYTVVGDELQLGPFQGSIACTRIAYGKGVCGTAWAEGKTLVVPDVDQFPGHIACSSMSRSEIVIPCIKDGKVHAVLDIDSSALDAFDATDARYLEQIVALL